MNPARLQLATIVSIPFEENTYIAHFEGQSECVVIDPGLEPAKILAYLEEHELVPQAILCTHGHSDHIAGNAELKSRWPNCLLVIGHGDAEMLTDPTKNLSAAFGIPIISPPADLKLKEGDSYQVAGFDFEVLEIPGHSPGHIVFIWRGGPTPVVFGGDVLFHRGIGRTDFPGGSFEQLQHGIHHKLFTLPEETIVYSGHGQPTTVGEEKRENPFVGASAGSWDF